MEPADLNGASPRDASTSARPSRLMAGAIGLNVPAFLLAVLPTVKNPSEPRDIRIPHSAFRVLHRIGQAVCIRSHPLPLEDPNAPSARSFRTLLATGNLVSSRKEVIPKIKSMLDELGGEERAP